MSKIESFSVHKRELGSCSPIVKGEFCSGSQNIPLVVEGYNYTEPPKVYRDGKMITPMKFYQDYSNMMYYILAYAPSGLKGSSWMVETYDFVEPVIYASGERMKVSLARRRHGYNRWSFE